MDPVVSVIIPVLNGAMVIGDQLEALAQQTYEGSFEVIVADNGSTDGTRDVAALFAGKLAHLEVVDASARRGANHARNQAAAAARGRLLAFWAADARPDEQWLEPIGASLGNPDPGGGALRGDRGNDASLRRWRPSPPLGRLRAFDAFLPYAVGA